jgi:hypothetical protein
MHRSPVVALLGLSFTPGPGRARCWRDHRGTVGFRRGLVVIIKQPWGEGWPHGPLDVIRQPTEQHMRPASGGQAVPKRPHRERHRFEAAKRPLYGRQAWRGAHRTRGVQPLRGDTGPQPIETIKRGCRGDTLGMAALGAPGICALQRNMLAHLEAVEHLAHPQGHRGLPGQPALGTRRGLPNRLPLARGRLQERLPFAPALVRQRRLVTGHQPLVWRGRSSEGDEVRVGTAPAGERATVDQRPDRRVAQGRHPVQALDWLELLAKASVGQQSPVPDQPHPSQVKALP